METIETLLQAGKIRLKEEPDHDWSMEDMKGDCFKPECNPDLSPEELKKQERDFEGEILGYGVVGLIAQYKARHGWVDCASCWGIRWVDKDSSDFSDLLQDAMSDYLEYEKTQKLHDLAPTMVDLLQDCYSALKECYESEIEGEALQDPNYNLNSDFPMLEKIDGLLKQL